MSLNALYSKGSNEAKIGALMVPVGPWGVVVGSTNLRGTVTKNSHIRHMYIRMKNKDLHAKNLGF